MSDEKLIGVVKWFNPQKGYGFASVPGQKDIFVHYSSIVKEGYKTLKENDKISFKIVQGDKGLQAQEVELVKE